MSVLCKKMIAIALTLGPVTQSHAEGNVAQGQALAQEWCVRCHDISTDGAFKLQPPSFASIAVFRDAKQIRWRIEFPPQHVDMPRLGFILDSVAIDDLTAFIISLEPDPGD